MEEYTINKNNIENTILNQENMPEYEFYNNNTLCIKAVMGLGKTNKLYDHLKKNKYESVLIISFRVSLEEKYATDLKEFELYNNITGNIDSTIHPFVVIQIDSLYRIKSHYDLIVFDEFTYTISHFITSCTTRDSVYECLIQLIEDDNKLIFMDALLCRDTVNWISTFSNRKINFIENKYSIHTDKKIISYKHDINNFIKSIKEALKNKQKIVIASNNKSEMNFVESTVKKNFPELKRLFISKETKNKYDMDLWNKVDVLAYTPTITAGVSFTEKRFDKVFGLFCNSSSPSDMSIQQLFRVRNISTNEYHICCKHTGKNDYPEDDIKIDKYILNNERCLVEGVKGIKLNYIKNELKKDRYYYLYKIVQKKVFKSKNNYIEYMIDLLKEQGISNIKYNCTYNKEETAIYNKEYKDHRNEAKDLEAELIVGKEPITEETANDLRNNYNKDYDDILSLKRYNFLNITKIAEDLLTKDIYKKYNKNNTQLYHLSYMYAYGDEVLNKLNDRINYIEKNIMNESTVKRLHKSKKYEKRIYATDILINMGFIKLFEYKEIELDKEKIKKYILENGKNLEILFSTNIYNWKDIIANDTKYFSKIMRYLNDRLNAIFKIRVVINKKTNKYYIKGLDFWDDNSVTYKNIVLLENIKNTEKELYLVDNLITDILNISNSDITDNSNNTCIICNKETINNNSKCLVCKYSF